MGAGVTLTPDTNLAFLKAIFVFAVVYRTGTGWRGVMLQHRWLQNYNSGRFVKIFKVWVLVFILLGQPGIFFFLFFSALALLNIHSAQCKV